MIPKTKDEIIRFIKKSQLTVCIILSASVILSMATTPLEDMMTYNNRFLIWNLFTVTAALIIVNLFEKVIEKVNTKNFY